MVRLAELMEFSDEEQDLHDLVARHAREGQLEIEGRTAGPDVRIGSMVVEVGALDRGQLNRLIEKQGSLNRRIGELLVEEGVIAAEEMESLLKIQVRLREAFADPGPPDPTPPLAD